MPRELASNEEITKMINDRLSESNELDGDCRDVRVGGVQRYAEPDETGCNWHVYTHQGPLERQSLMNFAGNTTCKMIEGHSWSEVSA